MDELCDSIRYYNTRPDDRSASLSRQVASYISANLGPDSVELAYLGFKRPDIREALYRMISNGSRVAVCAGAAGLMLPGHAAFEHVPMAIKKVTRDNAGLEVIYALPGIDYSTVANMIIRSILHAMGHTISSLRFKEEKPEVGYDTGVIVLSAPDRSMIQPESSSDIMAKFLDLSFRLSEKSLKWHRTMCGSEASDFMGNVAYHLSLSGMFRNVGTGFTDFSSPGIDTAMQRLVNAGSRKIIISGLPLLLQRSAFSVVNPSIDRLKERFPGVDMTFIEPAPTPIYRDVARIITKNVSRAASGISLKGEPRKEP